MKSKFSVSIVIPALNEESNIFVLVETLLKQKVSDIFFISQIVVISDGSTDNTVGVLNNIKSTKLHIEDFSIRKGKAYRLEQFFKTAKTDLVVQIDADLIIKDNNFLENLIEPFKDKKVGMVGANSIPLEPRTFVGKAINSSFRPYCELRDYYRSLSVGPALAYTSQLAKKIKFPKQIIGEDIFAFFTCLSNGYEYKYVKLAKVYIGIPENLSDHVAQNVRFMKSPALMKKYFSRELVEQEDYISKKHFIYYMGKEVLMHPVSALYIFLVNRYCRLLANREKDKIEDTWIISQSTKLKGSK